MPFRLIWVLTSCQRDRAHADGACLELGAAAQLRDEEG